MPHALILAAALVALSVGGPAYMVSMPGRSYAGDPPALTVEEQQVEAGLRRHIEQLAVQIGERNTRHPDALLRAESYLRGELVALGYQVDDQSFEADGMTVRNLEVRLPGTNKAGVEVLVGAHYDSAPGTPGADDNASGTAALLEIARAFAGKKPHTGLRLVAWVNEEPPHFKSQSMGSLHHAAALAGQGVKLRTMLSLETIAYYKDEPGTQVYPEPISHFYPDTGDFIAFVGDVGSRRQVREAIGLFREHASIPSEGAAVPAGIPGVSWSDHWSYWQHGYGGVMVTDTAPNRNPHYHEPTDLPGQLDLERAARVTVGLIRVVEDLCQVQ